MEHSHAGSTGGPAEYVSDDTFVDKTMPLLDDSPEGLNGPGQAKDEGVPLLDLQRMHLSFLDLTCEIRTGGRLCGDKGHTRAILNRVCGVAKPGELLAILGPSGSGKTTLLDTLSARKAPGAVKGEMSINGASPKKLFMQYGAYCAQDDVLNANLSVRETLKYAALLRLPFGMPYKDKMQRVEDILQLLGLKHVENARIGGLFIRGISGGERRRVSIGIELITSPSLLLLDEPTSGLDAKTAMDVMMALRKMAHAGMTVICTIHQPSSQIYELFDKLLLLTKGSVVYNGCARQAADYFSNLGYTCPVGWNVADYFLDIVSKEDSKQFLVDAYENSRARQEVAADLDRHHGHSKVGERQRSRPAQSQVNNGCGLYSWLPCTTPYPTPWLYQFMVLFYRNLVCLVKNPTMYLAVAGSYLLCGLMMGALFSDITTNAENQITLCLAFMIDVFGINAFFAIMTFMSDAAVFRRERASGYYPSSVYFLCHILISIPINMVVALMYSAVIFGIIGIADGDWSQFPMMFLYNYLALEVFLGLNEMLGALFSSLEIAILVAGVLNTIIMLFNGCFVNYTNIPSYLQWCYWIAPTTYALTGVMLLEFSGTDDGMQWLDVYGIQIYDQWTCAYALLGFVVGFRVLGYFTLAFSGKSRR